MKFSFPLFPLFHIPHHPNKSVNTFYTFPFSNHTESDETKPSSCELKFFFKIPMITTLSVLTLSELIQAIRLG